MKKIFVIGSYFSDDINEIKKNVKNADRAGRDLLKAGYLPFVPQSMLAYWEEEIDTDTIMQACFEWLENCDAVFCVKAGQAKKAAEFAKSKGKFIAYSIKDLDNFFNKNNR